MENFETFTNDLKCELRWLELSKDNDDDKISGIKQQKFLLFYNLFLKATNQDANFTGLCAWKGGPVYTQVHAAIKHHYTINEIIDSIDEDVPIDDKLAKVSKFITELLSDEEISNLTHEFDFWTTIDDNYSNNSILEKSISKEDEKRIFYIMNRYDLDFINNYKIYKTEHATFFIKNEEYDFVLHNFSDKLLNLKNDKPIKIELESKRLHTEVLKKFTS